MHHHRSMAISVISSLESDLFISLYSSSPGHSVHVILLNVLSNSGRAIRVPTWPTDFQCVSSFHLKWKFSTRLLSDHERTRAVDADSIVQSLPSNRAQCLLTRCLILEPNDAYLFKIFTFDSFLMCASIGVVLRVLYPGLKTPFRPPRIVLRLGPPAHTPFNVCLPVMSARMKGRRVRRIVPRLGPPPLPPAINLQTRLLHTSISHNRKS